MSESVLLRAANRPTRVVRHRNRNFWLDELKPNDVRTHADAGMRLVAGWQAGTVRLESTHPSFNANYLCHEGSTFQGRQCFLRADDGTDAFYLRSTFHKVAALNGDQACFSLQSVNFPDKYLRHEGFRVKITGPQADAPDDFSFYCVGNTVFDISRPTLRAANKPNHVVRHRAFEFWLDENEPTNVPMQADAGITLVAIASGHNSPPGSVRLASTHPSFEGYFLCHEDSVLSQQRKCYLRKDDGTDAFAQSCTFHQVAALNDGTIVGVASRGVQHCFSLRSTAFPDRYLRHECYRLKITEPQPDAPDDFSFYWADSYGHPMTRAEVLRASISHASISTTAASGHEPPPPPPPPPPQPPPPASRRLYPSLPPAPPPAAEQEEEWTKINSLGNGWVTTSASAGAAAGNAAAEAMEALHLRGEALGALGASVSRMGQQVWV